MKVAYWPFSGIVCISRAPPPEQFTQCSRVYPLKIFLREFDTFAVFSHSFERYVKEWIRILYPNKLQNLLHFVVFLLIAPRDAELILNCSVLVKILTFIKWITSSVQSFNLSFNSLGEVKSDFLWFVDVQLYQRRCQIVNNLFLMNSPRCWTLLKWSNYDQATHISDIFLSLINLEPFIWSVHK